MSFAINWIRNCIYPLVYKTEGVIIVVRTCLLSYAKQLHVAHLLLVTVNCVAHIIDQWQTRRVINQNGILARCLFLYHVLWSPLMQYQRDAKVQTFDYTTAKSHDRQVLCIFAYIYIEIHIYERIESWLNKVVEMCRVCLSTTRLISISTTLGKTWIISVMIKTRIATSFHETAAAILHGVIWHLKKSLIVRIILKNIYTHIYIYVSMCPLMVWYHEVLRYL